MRLYGALSELASLVIRLASGKTVTISSVEQNVDKTISIPALPEAVNSDEIVLKEAQQTLRRKTLEGVVTSGVSSVQLQSADVTSTNALEVPNGNPSISTVLRRLSSTGNLLYLGTGTGFKELVDKDSSQQLKNKIIVAGSGIDENAITNLNPASANVFATVGGHADKVVKYDNSGIPQVAKIVNANVDDAAGIDGDKMMDNSINIAKMESMSSADLAGKITDETGSGALVFANNPTIGTITAASGVLSIAGTGALRLPFGDDTQKPGGIAANLKGMIRYNDQQDAFEGYNELSGWSALGGGGASERVSQTGLGVAANFPVGTPLYVDATLGWQKAKADAANTAEVAGILGRRIDDNTVEVTLAGEVAGVAAALFENPASLPPRGELVFLSPTTAGKLTTTEPTVVGQVSKPVGIVHNVNAGVSVDIMFFNMRGTVVGGANLRTQIGLNGAALVSQTTNIQNVTAYTAGELSGWVYIDATTDRRFYIQVQFVKDASNAWRCAYQTTGDTPPAGFNVDVIVSGADAFVQVQMPPVAGFNSATSNINFALNAPAVGATLPLAISPTNISGTGDIAMQAGYGISFGNEVLKHYDEGTWTPGITFGGNSVGVSYGANRFGHYTRIGNRCFFHCYVLLASKGSSTGPLNITGLPFTVATMANGGTTSVAIWVSGISVNGGMPVGYTIDSSTRIDVNYIPVNQNAGEAQQLLDGFVSNTASFMVSGSYIIA